MDFDWMFWPKLLLTIIVSGAIGGTLTFGIVIFLLWVFT